MERGDRLGTSDKPHAVAPRQTSAGTTICARSSRAWRSDESESVTMGGNGNGNGFPPTSRRQVRKAERGRTANAAQHQQPRASAILKGRFIPSSRASPPSAFVTPPSGRRTDKSRSLPATRPRFRPSIPTASLNQISKFLRIWMSFLALSICRTICPPSISPGAYGPLAAKTLSTRPLNSSNEQIVVTSTSRVYSNSKGGWPSA